MSPELYFTYLLAGLVIVLVPGPTVTVIIANSLTHGTRAGLLNVAGTQLGLGLMMVAVAIGLTSLIATMGVWFDWVRLAGAGYLVWLGWKLLRAPVAFDAQAGAPAPRGGFFLQGLMVILANPKALLLFGAFIPQFIDPTGDYVWQVILLGVTFMVEAAVSDSVYAVLTGRARALLSGRRALMLSRGAGLFLIGGGAWLALLRAR